MKNNCRAFVLLETIVVITVLCVILIVLYASYSKILVGVKNSSVYDNTEYISKTELLRTYIESEEEIMELVGSDSVIVYCSNTLASSPNCSDSSTKGHELFEFMKVNSIYFTLWDIDERNEQVLALEATTQNYIKLLDAVNKGPIYRLIVMYKPENDELSTEYEYASLRLGSRD